jgi:hypothetical protein
MTDINTRATSREALLTAGEFMMSVLSIALRSLKPRHYACSWIPSIGDLR